MPIFGSPEHIKQLAGKPLWELFVNFYWVPAKGYAKGRDIADENPHQTRDEAEKAAHEIDGHDMQYQYTVRVSKQEGGRPVSEVIIFNMPDKRDWACDRADTAVNEQRRGEA